VTTLKTVELLRPILCSTLFRLNLGRALGSTNTFEFKFCIRIGLLSHFSLFSALHWIFYGSVGLVSDAKVFVLRAVLFKRGGSYNNISRPWCIGGVVDHYLVGKLHDQCWLHERRSISNSMHRLLSANHGVLHWRCWLAEDSLVCLTRWLVRRSQLLLLYLAILVHLLSWCGWLPMSIPILRYWELGHKSRWVLPRGVCVCFALDFYEMWRLYADGSLVFNLLGCVVVFFINVINRVTLCIISNHTLFESIIICLVHRLLLH